jgi:transcription elongation GreA/GreB family factor
MAASSADKRTIVATLRARIAEEIAETTRIARDAAAAASHEENKPENDKDMRSTEASYVAKGQADRVRALEHALAVIGSMTVKDFAEGEPIQTSAVVDIAVKGARTRYLILPTAGGMKIRVEDEDVHTLATTSPLGRALLGLAEGDEAEVETPQGVRTYVILAVR